jgi:hypothetical protein
MTIIYLFIYFNKTRPPQWNVHPRLLIRTLFLLLLASWYAYQRIWTHTYVDHLLSYFERLIEYFLCLKSNLITSRSLLVVALWPNRWASFDLEDLWMLENWKGKLKYMESWIRAWNTNNGEYFSPPVTWARTLTIINAWFALEGLLQWSTGEACLASVPSSTLHVHVCHPCGVLPVYWACRMFSRSEE